MDLLDKRDVSKGIAVLQLPVGVLKLNFSTVVSLIKANTHA
jgi:hypothetical protein